MIFEIQPLEVRLDLSMKYKLHIHIQILQKRQNRSHFSLQYFGLYVNNFHDFFKKNSEILLVSYHRRH